MSRNARKGPFERFQLLTNIRSTKVERMLGKCWTQKQSCAEVVQTVPTLGQQKNLEPFREIWLPETKN